MDVYLVNVHLTGVHLIGVYFMDVYIPDLPSYKRVVRWWSFSALRDRPTVHRTGWAAR
jgi:hypothetical protein